MKVNSWTHWQPLKQVVLGNCFDTNFFDDVKDIKLRDSLHKIIDETKEDLQGIKDTLTDLGVEVIQVDKKWTNACQINPYESFREFLEVAKSKDHPLLKPLMAPRDNYITLGDELFLTCSYSPSIAETREHPLDMFDCRLDLVDDMWKHMNTRLGPFTPNSKWLKETIGIENEMWSEQKYFNENMKYDPFRFKNYVTKSYIYDAPFITRIGKDLLIDEERTSGFWEWYNTVKPNHQHRKKAVVVGGHNDASMCLPRPGLVIGAPWMNKGFFEDTLPGWEQLIIEHPNNFQNQYPKEFDELKRKQSSMSWFVDGETGNKPLTDFVDTYLKEWVGYMEESIFEINMLSVDENTILSLNYQKDVHDKLTQHNIQPIYCRFRHRHFWDGGLHCLTVDTNREGKSETYL